MPKCKDAAPDPFGGGRVRTDRDQRSNIGAKDLCEKRNGHGVQEWSEGSKYEGEFAHNLKHGAGVFTWINGEIYEGSFYKDYRHGHGTYSWPGGFKFVGKFYLNQKEGYGVQMFSDGSTFQGLYHSDERFGPGVMTYPDGRQDVGLWHGERLLRLCTALEGGFTLHAFPEYRDRTTYKKEPPQSHNSETNARPGTRQTIMDPILASYHELLQDEHFIMPPDMGRYSTDSDHLPLPIGFCRELDVYFFGKHCDDLNTNPVASAALTLQQRMQAHIHKHRFEIESLNWDVEAVLSKNRGCFGPKGPLELYSEGLIQEASLGNRQSVYRILRNSKIHPDVGDAQGHTALIAATVNCHNDVIHLLLDSGADVNKLNCEEMSALAVCYVLHYPIQSLNEKVDEKCPQKNHPKLQPVKPQYLPVNCPQRSLVEATENKVQYTKLINKVDNTAPEDDINQADNAHLTKFTYCQQSLYNSHCYCPDKANYTDQKTPRDEDEHYLLECSNQTARDPEHMGINEVTNGSSIKVLNGNVPLGSVPWHDGVGSERVTKQQQGEKDVVAGIGEDLGRREKRGSIFDEPAFDSARSLAGIHIQITEEVMEKTAEALSRTGLLPPDDTQETVRKMALLKTLHRGRWTTIKLLLDRGADPNASSVPMPVLFLAIKAGHIQAVRHLLECGARTDMCLPPKQNGLFPLHIAAALPGAEGPKITRLLLHALADPNVTALDVHEVFELDKVSRTVKEKSLMLPETQLIFVNPVEPQPAFGNKSSIASAPLADFYTAPSVPPQEGGRTPLHVACQRDKDYINARDVVLLLLSHKACTNLLWSGHSPLSLAIASGNDLAVDELLAGGADPNLPLSRRVGSALCAMTNINYDRGAHLCNRTKLLDKLIKAGANILMPVVVGEGRMCAVGTAVDYAHCALHQNWRIAHTPYHELNQREREVYNSFRQILSLMGDLLRQAAVRMERQHVEEKDLSINGFTGSTQKCLYAGAGTTLPWNKATTVTLPEEQASKDSPPQQIALQQRSKAAIFRKPPFKYCYQCGRSVGVVLNACNRCHEVFYCSKTCKMKAWNDRHKAECVHMPVMPKGPNIVVRKTKMNKFPQELLRHRQHLGVIAKIQNSQFNLAQKLSKSNYENLKENYSFI